METYYYRPKWTCGRYDEKTHSAIYYNLLSGQHISLRTNRPMSLGAFFLPAEKGSFAFIPLAN